jgi:hypothetical protein
VNPAFSHRYNSGGGVGGVAFSRAARDQFRRIPLRLSQINLFWIALAVAVTIF